MSYLVGYGWIMWDNGTLFQYVGMMLQGAKLLGIGELDGSRQAFSYNIYNVYVSHLTISDQVNKRLCINRVKISHFSGCIC